MSDDEELKKIFAESRVERKQKERHWKKKRRRRLIIALVILVVIIVVVVIGVIGSSQISDFFKNIGIWLGLYKPQSDSINFLCLGIDNAPKNPSADLILLVSYNKIEKKLNLISIPEKMFVAIPGHPSAEIRTAYTLGREQLVISTVQNLLSIQINKYIKIDIEGAEKVIDKIGKIPYDVEKNMDYEAASTNTKIHLKKGKQNLTGKQVLDYMRFKSDSEAEAGRIKRQQKMASVVTNEAKNKIELKDIPGLYSELQKSFTTNMSYTELYTLACTFKNLDKKQINFLTLPTNIVTLADKAYLQPDKERIATEIIPILAKVEPEQKTTNPIRLEVLNGAGDPGLASKAAKGLTEMGYKVISTRNANNFNYKETQIILYKYLMTNQSEENKYKTEAAEIKKLLGGVGKIIINLLKQNVTDITIIIGKDYAPKRRVQVLNGCGNKAATDEAVDKLAKAGFYIVKKADADSDKYGTTRIIVYTTRQLYKDKAEDIRVTLGVGEIVISDKPIPDIDFTVILGKDYSG